MPATPRRPLRRLRRLNPNRICVVVNRASESAVTLARNLAPDAKVIRVERLAALATKYKYFFNWGCSSLPVALPSDRVLFNKPDAVVLAVNKRTFFEEYADLTNMKVAYNRADATNLFSKHRKVVCRTRVNGSSGEGIVIARNPDELVDASLYTAYIPKQAEYRVHVVKGTVVVVQQKRARAGHTMTDDQQLVRNHANGWVFAVENVDTPNNELLDACIKLVNEMGLDYAGVDVMVGAKNGKPYILEVNTAVGLESPTLISKITTAMKEKLINGS